LGLILQPSEARAQFTGQGSSPAGDIRHFFQKADSGKTRRDLDFCRGDQESCLMVQVTPRPLTKYDYWVLPEAGPRYQLINGNLFMAPAPNRFHQDISRSIQFQMMKYLEVKPAGIIYNAPFDVVLTDINVFQPDLAFFSERRQRFLTEKGAEGAPDLVVEILSPTTANLDLDQKRVVYSRAGVDELWIVDPLGEEIRVYHLRRSGPTKSHFEIRRCPQNIAASRL
jgi:Uma2 family endonuclease